MKKIILSLFLGIFLISFASATLNAHGEAFSGSSNPTLRSGVEIVANNSVLLSQIVKDGGSTATICYVYDNSKTEVASGTFTGNNCSVNYSITKGDTYYAMVDKGGVAYTRTDTGAPSFPYKAPDLNFTDSCYDWNGAKACGGGEIYDVASIITEENSNITTTLESPSNGFTSILPQIRLNVSVSVVKYSLVNTTFYVWNSTGQIYNKTTNTTFTSIQNTTIVNVTGFGNIGNYEWNAKVCGTNATSYKCVWAISNYTFSTGSNISNIKANLTTTETKSEYFGANLSVLTGYTPTDGKLIWNKTSYTATITSLGGDEYYISKTIDIPISNKSVGWFFNWTLDNIKQSSTNTTQNVTRVWFDFCNTTLTDAFLNLTFKDETNLTKMNATIPSSTFVYYLGSGLINKTFTYVNNTKNPSYAFCSSAGSQTLKSKVRVQYTATSYQQRVYNVLEALYTTTVTDKILYLLSTADGLYVTFQVLNTADQTLSGVEVTANQTLDGTSELVESGTTSGAGAVTFWLNPNNIHLFRFVKTGYTTFESSFQPTNSEYTITLGGTSTTTENDYSRGVSYTILPIDGSLNSSTNYLFSFTINSSYWDLDEYGFILRNNTGEALSTQSGAVGTGGVVSDTINVSNYSYITMEFYYVINGSYQNQTTRWIVYNYDGTDFSIWRFFQDFTSYVSSGDGILGLRKDADNNFALDLLIYSIILLSTGILSYQFGITTPSAILGIVFSLVLFFDFGLGLLSNPVGAVPYFPTIFVGIIAVAELMREVAVR